MAQETAGPGHRSGALASGQHTFAVRLRWLHWAAQPHGRSGVCHRNSHTSPQRPKNTSDWVEESMWTRKSVFLSPGSRIWAAHIARPDRPPWGVLCAESAP